MNIMTPRDAIMKLFDDKIEGLEKDLERAAKDGMPTKLLQDEIDTLEILKDEIDQIFEYYG